MKTPELNHKTESHNDSVSHETIYLSFFVIIPHQILYHVGYPYILKIVKMSKERTN